MAREEATNLSKTPAGRVRRNPVAARGPLPKIDVELGYTYRIVNNVDDRVEHFKDGGWEVVGADALKRNARRVDQYAPTGSAAEISVGQGMKAIVMRQKNEWYEEDQALKQAQVDASEQAMKRDALDKGLTVKDLKTTFSS